jgi:hypothetical protein
MTETGVDVFFDRLHKVIRLFCTGCVVLGILASSIGNLGVGNKLVSILFGWVILLSKVSEALEIGLQFQLTNSPMPQPNSGVLD